MTSERKDEIWAMLPSWFRRQLIDEYDDAKLALALDPANPRIQTHLAVLEAYFGFHNLTAQAEEKPKEPKFKVGDKVFYDGLVYEIECRTGKFHYALKGRKHDVVEDSLISYPFEKSESNVESEVYGNNVHSNPSKSVGLDYAAYRLALAKEIALKVANNRMISVAKFAVDTANEIVKRLKETEE